MEYRVKQNPEYVDGSSRRKKYVLYKLSGELVGKRNKHGIIASSPGKIFLVTDSFKDNHCLDELLGFLERRNVPYELI